jgi:DNA-binding FadR family transcriptional regulator
VLDSLAEGANAVTACTHLAQPEADVHLPCSAARVDADDLVTSVKRLVTFGVLPPEIHRSRIAAESAEALLPAHGDIADQAGVSRATAREAFLVLELIGAVEVRQGDGTFVRARAPRVGGLETSALAAPPQELIETRLHIEPIATALAAQRITRSRADQLETNVQQQQERVSDAGETPAFVTLGLQFHSDLAPACGNSLLAGVVRQLVDVERHPLWALINQLGLPDAASRQKQVDEHREILDAILAGDADRAAKAMRHHLSALETATFGESRL